MIVDEFRDLPVMGIVRGGDADHVPDLVDTVVDAGLRTLEITMNTTGAPEMIRRAVQAAHGRLVLGAGTVLSVEDLDRATDAGASFIVMPVLVPEVVEACAKRGTPVFPGAFTPQEIFDAWRAGATMVKVFPAKFHGPGWFREIRGPFADIPLLACGGVSADTVADFFAAGASAVAFGGSIFRSDLLKSGDFDPIGAGIRRLLAACPSS